MPDAGRLLAWLEQAPYQGAPSLWAAASCLPNQQAIVARGYFQTIRVYLRVQRLVVDTKDMARVTVEIEGTGQQGRWPCCASSAHGRGLHELLLARLSETAVRPIIAIPGDWAQIHEPGPFSPIIHVLNYMWLVPWATIP